MSVGTLSHEQARHFANQGYYKLKDVFNKPEVEQLKDFVMAEATQDPTTKLYGLYDRNVEVMHKVVTHPNLTGALQSLLGPNVLFVKNRHNHATVNDQQGQPREGLHRDILQLSRGVITAAIYLEDATPCNGATRIIPGSHMLPNVGVPQPSGGGTWLAEHDVYAGMEDQAIDVPMSAGAVLLFNGMTFHGVGSNTSGGTRISMTLGYRSADELDYAPDQDRLVVVTGSHIYRGNDC